jgi:hypothetical protein
MVRLYSGVNRLTLSAVAALAGLALASPPAVASPYQPISTIASSQILAETSYGGRRVSYYTYVANTGDQQTVNKCAGGLTYYTEISEFMGKPYYPIHNECGGRPILRLKVGDLVSIHQNGVYEVIAIQDVTRGDTALELLTLPGDAYLQTCFDSGNEMRVVGLKRASQMST